MCQNWCAYVKKRRQFFTDTNSWLKNMILIKRPIWKVKVILKIWMYMIPRTMMILSFVQIWYANAKRSYRPRPDTNLHSQMDWQTDKVIPIYMYLHELRSRVVQKIKKLIDIDIQYGRMYSARPRVQIRVVYFLLYGYDNYSKFVMIWTHLLVGATCTTVSQFILGGGSFFPLAWIYYS